jgi:hypothetical protein
VLGSPAIGFVVQYPERAIWCGAHCELPLKRGSLQRRSTHHGRRKKFFPAQSSIGPGARGRALASWRSDE